MASETSADVGDMEVVLQMVTSESLDSPKSENSRQKLTDGTSL